MKKKRTKTYLGTFYNDADGNANYQRMIRDLRHIIAGGRFVKMFRNGKRTPGSASTLNEGASHFDCYLLSRNHQLPTYLHTYRA